METELKANCHDCDANPGEFHDPGCDVERCPYCGGQLISCDCTRNKKKMTWIEKNRLPWTGIWPGTVEAVEFGLYSKWIPNKQFEDDKARLGLDAAFRRLGTAPMGRWAVCEKDDPEATPDLNRLNAVAVWDREKKRFVRHG